MVAVYLASLFLAIDAPCARVAALDGAPVVNLLPLKPDASSPEKSIRKDLIWSFEASAEQIKAFMNAMILIRRFTPAQVDESFDVSLLTPDGE